MPRNLARIKIICRAIWQNFDQNFDFAHNLWLKFRCLTKMLILPVFCFLTKIWIFDKKYGFLTKKYGFLTKNMNFGPKLFLTNIFLAKLWIFDLNLDF